jgi:hypothetical protein
VPASSGFERALANLGTANQVARRYLDDHQDELHSQEVEAFKSVRGISLPGAWVYAVKIADQAGHTPATSTDLGLSY